MQRLPIMRSHYEKTRSKTSSALTSEPASKTQSRAESPESMNIDHSQTLNATPVFIPEMKKVKKSPSKKPKLDEESKDSRSPKLELSSKSPKKTPGAKSPSKEPKRSESDDVSIEFNKQVSLKLERLEIKPEMESPVKRKSKYVSTSSELTSEESLGNSQSDRVKHLLKTEFAKSSLESEVEVTKDSSEEKSKDGASQLRSESKQSEIEEGDSSNSDAVKNAVGESVSSSSSPAKSQKSSLVRAAVKVEWKEEVNEEVDICEKIFLDIRSKTSFVCFENVECVSAPKR